VVGRKSLFGDVFLRVSQKQLKDEEGLEIDKKIPEFFIFS
jgi:hypothetical protein